MIHINCTSCQATLEIDDAFAGGVCRCQHCGTIQTVPAHLKGNAPDAPAATHQQQQQPVYQAGRGGGTGLDELSDAVVSSGLARSGLRSKSKGSGNSGGLLDAAGAVGGMDYATPARRQQPAKPPVALIAIGCGVALVAVIAVAWFLFRSSSTPKPQPAPRPVIVKDTNGGSSNTGGEEERIVVPKSAHFCGVDLSASTGVTYILDRGSASAALFDSLKAATFKSIASLGPNRKFAVVFWRTGNAPVVAYPTKGLTPATQKNIDAADKAFDDVIAHGRSDPMTAIQDAGPRGASDVVFVTAKSDDVPDSVVAAIGKAFAGKRVHTFALGEDAGSPLKSIAQQHGGGYRVLRDRELDVYSAR